MQMLELSREGSWKQSAPRATGEACETITKPFLESTKKVRLRSVQRNITSPQETQEYHA